MQPSALEGRGGRLEAVHTVDGPMRSEWDCGAGSMDPPRGKCPEFAGKRFTFPTKGWDEKGGGEKGQWGERAAGEK